MGVSREVRRWEEELTGRVAQRLAEERPSNVVVPIPGTPQYLPRLLRVAERVFSLWGYRLDRTEPPVHAKRGLQVYAVFVRSYEVEDQPTTGWLG